MSDQGPLSAFSALMRKDVLETIESSKLTPEELSMSGPASKTRVSRIVREIAEQEEAEAARQRRREELTALRTAAFTQVSPENVASLRARIMRIAEQRLIDADLVLAGRKVWSQSQVGIFRTLLNKVIPDVHHSEVRVGVETRPLQELSRSELEALVASHRAAEARTIDAAEALAAALSTGPSATPTATPPATPTATPSSPE